MSQGQLPVRCWLGGWATTSTRVLYHYASQSSIIPLSPYLPTVWGDRVWPVHCPRETRSTCLCPDSTPGLPIIQQTL